MKTKTKVIIASIIGSLGILTMLNLYINETGKQDVVVIDKTSAKQTEGQNKTETTTTSIIATKTTKTTKKVVKTTKKTTKKVSKSKINISYNRQEIIDYTHQEVVRRWGEDQWEATYQLIMHESGFNPNKVNTKSGACGIFQANPCSKVIKHGYTKYYTDWKEQVRWGLDWITVHKRYGTPKKAWEYWKKHGNY